MITSNENEPSSPAADSPARTEAEGFALSRLQTLTEDTLYRAYAAEAAGDAEWAEEYQHVARALIATQLRIATRPNCPGGAND
jgi:hypothetical protein